MDRIENRIFDEIQLGESASLTRTLTHRDIELFAIVSGDVNPAHLDEAFAKSDMFQKIIAHGMWGGALISAVLGTQLPGPGTIYISQSLRFRRPIGVGDTVTVTLTVTDKNQEKHRLTLDCTVTNQRNEVVITGAAEVIAPTEKISRPRIELPEVKFAERQFAREKHMLRFLLAVDGSEASARAVDYFLKELSLYKEPVEVGLINVQSPPPGGITMFIDQRTLKVLYEHQGLKEMAPAREKLDATGLRYAYHVGIGEPARVITDYATEQNCDQIIMGTRGVNAVTGILFGSIARKVVHLSRVPVLLVK